VGDNYVFNSQQKKHPIAYIMFKAYKCWYHTFRNKLEHPQYTNDNIKAIGYDAFI